MSINMMNPLIDMITILILWFGFILILVGLSGYIIVKSEENDDDDDANT